MVHGDGQTSEAERVAVADGLLQPRPRAQVAARIERSTDIAGIHIGLSPPPRYRLAA